MFRWIISSLASTIFLLTASPSLAFSKATSLGRCAALPQEGTALPPARFEDGPMIAPAALVADFDTWMAGIQSLNPDLGIRANLQELNAKAASIRAELTRPMSRREVWQHFATLNPFFRDGHAGVQMPAYRDALAAHLKAGGLVIPVDVRFAPDGSLRIFTVAAGESAIKPGDRLLSINGHDTAEMLSRMMLVAISDTPKSQRTWVEHRFAMLYWYLFGDTGQYDIEVQSETGCPHQVRASGGKTVPEALRAQESPEEMFEWRILDQNIGYLRVDGFSGDLKDAYFAFTRAAFAAFKERNVRALIIDVRENDGGDDPLWQQGLVDHFTTKPYVQLSHYVTRITNDNAEPGDVIGSIKSEDYTKLFTPPSDDPIRFNGPVYALSGPNSYSATIQFMVAVQDYGLAKVAGEETAALSCQTGQVKRIALPWTGLSAATPIIAYTRPSGHGCKRGVIPDIPIIIDEAKPQETLKALEAWIITHG
jgi:C-terminal processing protease CtpA/Prc